MADYSLFTEQQLAEMLKAGDRMAFEMLYHIYSKRILKKLIRLLKDEEKAKEILQDVFLKIWEKREALDPEKSFRSLLFKIAENKVTDFFRKLSSDKKMIEHLVIVSTELYNGTEEIVQYNESNSVLKQAINALPEQRRKVFELCKLEGKSYEEVALMMGISKGTVNDHIVKAMRSVKNHFSADDLAFTALVAFVFQNIK